MTDTSKDTPWRAFRYPDNHLTDDMIDNPERLAELLSRLKLAEQDMKPGTLGGIFNNPANDSVTFARDATCVPPDVPKNTRILSFLSIWQSSASPTLDGWFISDFFAFYHLFQNLTPNQTWLHSLDLDSLIDDPKIKRYLHSSPWGKRKVVLDRDILAKIKRGEYHELLKVKELNLRAKFVELLKERLKAASDNGENLLIMILGHGQADTGHLIVGDRGRPFTVKNLIKKFKDVPDVPVMLANDYNAVPFLKSSIKRASGSKFVSAVTKTLTSNPTAKKSLEEEVEDMEDDEEIGELSGLSGQQLHERTDSYAELTGTSYEALAIIDRRAYKHQISFKAQDNDWSANGHVRTGIAMQDLRSRWEALQE
ncbi:hypothetical protein MBM_04469 [Drepanopeziza brunnea f. sp. 'multigermtubi' MB_m1]|uniref:Uncharacterized protein n=1 Tax=Marssonina brunnea f. sp. multigermtubi (strain MB_m1) TaxID=1072389 RepID=K1XA71_MARBU|nr:uncharacterized protein MBM_04469 [Drepanopeziza brunnea f. sp. 'multigermtubi' MB_m1]EKD17608.1 hypothetical protein MBM_04469 [Drepanopeziza brunnea f. sp. 'multigermtubi' MB_m1]